MQLFLFIFFPPNLILFLCAFRPHRDLCFFSRVAQGGPHTNILSFRSTMIFPSSLYSWLLPHPSVKSRGTFPWGSCSTSICFTHSCQIRVLWLFYVNCTLWPSKENAQQFSLFREASPDSQSYTWEPPCLASRSFWTLVQINKTFLTLLLLLLFPLGT